MAWKNNFLGIQDVVASVVEWFTTVALPAIQEFFMGVIEWVKDLGQSFMAMVEQAKLFLEPFFNWFMEIVYPLLQSFFGLVTDLIKLQVTIWVETFRFWWNLLQSITSWLVGIFQPIVQGIMNFLSKHIKAQIALWVTSFKFWWNIIKAVGNFLKEVFQPVVSGVMSFVTKQINQAVDRWVDRFNIVKRVVEGVIGVFQSLIDKAREAVQVATEGLGGAPSFQFGGFVPRTGLAFLHKGEFVVSREMQDGRRELPTGIEQTFNQPITIDATITSELDIDLLGERLAFALRNSR